MNEYALAFLAGVWLADGVSLLIAPRALLNRLKEITSTSPGIFRWQILTITAGIVLFIFGFDLPYQLLWIVTSLGMIVKGLFLWLSSSAYRRMAIEWMVARDDVDARFMGLGLCTLAMLLLHALGWIGQPQ